MKGGVFVSDSFYDERELESTIRALSGEKEVRPRAHYRFEIDIMGDSRKAPDRAERSGNRDELTDGTSHF